jgi:hypothetical protein
MGHTCSPHRYSTNTYKLRRPLSKQVSRQQYGSIPRHATPPSSTKRHQARPSPGGPPRTDAGGKPPTTRPHAQGTTEHNSDTTHTPSTTSDRGPCPKKGAQPTPRPRAAHINYTHPKDMKDQTAPNAQRLPPRTNAKANPPHNQPAGLPAQRRPPRTNTATHTPRPPAGPRTRGGTHPHEATRTHAHTTTKPTRPAHDDKRLHPQQLCALCSSLLTKGNPPCFSGGFLMGGGAP